MLTQNGYVEVASISMYIYWPVPTAGYKKIEYAHSTSGLMHFFTPRGHPRLGHRIRIRLDVNTPRYSTFISSGRTLRYVRFCANNFIRR
jgi:hypothetical protein